MLEPKLNTEYRILDISEISRELFAGFIRRQTVTKCRRMENGKWTVKAAPFIDDWTENDYYLLTKQLAETIEAGGFVYAAFDGGILKGFVETAPEIFGGSHMYADLKSIYVSADMRGRGIGTRLFDAAKEWAKSHGAKKLYISAHSAVESQAFYAKMGCTEAELYSRKHVEQEPFDCQLELKL